MTAISLRQADPADWPAVQALLQTNGLPVEGAREHLETFLLAQAGQGIVGCAGTEPYGDVALLRSVAVAPDLHKQGIGKQLVSRLLEEARQRDIKTVYLLTTTARDYFLGYGFRPANRDTAPSALKQSAEFQGACPNSADFMVLTGIARAS
jgi:N-acetylglutamate synthase-like GNAT family acetyltransferase